MLKDAYISECGDYRYWLTRNWSNGADKNELPIIMLNPSTADHTVDDPTIKRCISFADLHGYNSLRVFNLFPLRATDPKFLYIHPYPKGFENRDIISQYFSKLGESPEVLVAWGVRGGYLDQDKKIIDLIKVCNKNVKFVCLGRTKDGLPKHPLYVRKENRFTEYEMPTR